MFSSACQTRGTTNLNVHVALSLSQEDATAAINSKPFQDWLTEPGWADL